MCHASRVRGSGVMTARVRLKMHRAALFVVFLVLVVDSVSGMFEHRQCSHRHPKAHEVVHGVHVDPVHEVKKRSISQPLRILLWYDESVYRLDDEKLDLINNTILPEAVHFWERALMVRETKNTIRLNRKCESNQVFVKNQHTYCIDTCRTETVCGEVVVPPEHLDVCRTCNATGHDCGVAEGSKAGPGIDGSDFVFYVSAMQTERCHKGLTVAYAAHCQQEAALDRPIAGHANLCPGSISTKPQELETLLSTVKHEILHALGFSVSLYAFYRDENGEPRTPRRAETGKPTLNEKLQTHQWSENTIKTISRPGWQVHGGSVERHMQMIVTPNVQKEVRRHFNCDKLEGAELEDQGEDGTALTHWEKRVFENEAMTGTHTQNPVYSRITLALMEDTGWYSANYSMAQELGWGRNLGCNFAMKSCKEWISTKLSHFPDKKGKSIHPFCNKVKRDPLHTECTDDRSSVALCNLIEHPRPLPKKYQNFDSIPHVPSGREEYYGGSVSLADYCPYIQEFTWKARNIVVRGSHCLYEENNPILDKNFAVEKYGPQSRCFDNADQMWEERNCKQARQWQHWGSGCYQYKCELGRLHIVVGNYTFTCFHSGQEIAIRVLQNNWLHKGALKCPPCKDICQAEFKARGEWCKKGEEHPPPNFYPTDSLNCSLAARTSATGIVPVFAMLVIFPVVYR
ncbi:leishmanolysin-like peptidase isoform X1 [Neodiprion lecontei]|uniref:Leishmanolysin-like peptidase n=1 Tax=Neodiprion lecontei TaxID=441921 RepID=A0ABM3GIG8_NEOLC|nr:leishmanolysin-like peptidase isoform X1 [Neodiprion lecontei]